MSETDLAIVEGMIAVEAVVSSRRRDVAVIYFDRKKQDQHTRRLTHLAEQRSIPVERVDRERLEAICGNATHGGVAASVGPRQFQMLDELGAKAASPFIVMLDGVEDPYNFGSAVRVLFAAGADGLVLRPRNWSSAAGTVIRASAGASERMPTAIAEEPLEAATHFRARGLAVAVTSKAKGAVSLYQTDLTKPFFLLIGGEKRGVQRSFLERADQLLYIPYGRRFDYSLGTVGAAAAIAFEVMRQRQIGR